MISCLSASRLAGGGTHFTSQHQLCGIALWTELLTPLDSLAVHDESALLLSQAQLSTPAQTIRPSQVMSPQARCTLHIQFTKSSSHQDDKQKTHAAWGPHSSRCVPLDFLTMLTTQLSPPRLCLSIPMDSSTTPCNCSTCPCTQDKHRGGLTGRRVVPGGVVDAHAGGHQGPKVHLLALCRQVALAQGVQARKLHHQPISSPLHRRPALQLSSRGHYWAYCTISPLTHLSAPQLSSSAFNLLERLPTLVVQRTSYCRAEHDKFRLFHSMAATEAEPGPFDLHDSCGAHLVGLGCHAELICTSAAELTL